MMMTGHKIERDERDNNNPEQAQQQQQPQQAKKPEPEQVQQQEQVKKTEQEQYEQYCQRSSEMQETKTDSLFIPRVAKYYFEDEHVIPPEVEARLIDKVVKHINQLSIGNIKRVDLKVVNVDTQKFIHAFIHLSWFNNASAKQAQENLKEGGQFLCPIEGGKRVWFVKRNNNPMSFEEVCLMKELGAVIREMNNLHTKIKTIMAWPGLDLYINDIDTIVKHDQFEMEDLHGLKSRYGQRYTFMWLKYQRCSRLIIKLKRVLLNGEK